MEQSFILDSLYNLVKPGTTNLRLQRDQACALVTPEGKPISSECQVLNQQYGYAVKTATSRLFILSGIGGLGALYGVIRLLRRRA